jgi:hypothetical protein
MNAGLPIAISDYFSFMLHVRGLKAVALPARWGQAFVIFVDGGFMNRTTVWKLTRVSMLVMAGLAMGCSQSPTSEPGAKKLAAADLPANIMNTVNGRLPGAQITSAEKETENGAVVYDLELKQQGRKYEKDVKEDGTLVEIEKQVMTAEVLENVTKAVKEKYPDAMVKEVMEVNKVEGKQETPQHYEAVISTGGKDKEVIVSLDGKSLKEEAAEETPKK